MEFGPDQKTIIEIISKFLPAAHIYLFGSRARNAHHSRSDFDVAIDNNTKIDPIVLCEIKEKIEESTIPFNVDIIDLQNISDEFKKEILKDKVLWK